MCSLPSSSQSQELILFPSPQKGRFLPELIPTLISFAKIRDEIILLGFYNNVRSQQSNVNLFLFTATPGEQCCPKEAEKPCFRQREHELAQQWWNEAKALKQNKACLLQKKNTARHGIYTAEDLFVLGHCDASCINRCHINHIRGI